jgi:hypothetical protein
MAVGNMNEGRVTDGWLPFEDTPRPLEIAKCRFELFPAPGGVIAIFAEDYDAAGRIFRWLVGQAMTEKESQREGGGGAAD